MIERKDHAKLRSSVAERVFSRREALSQVRFLAGLSMINLYKLDGQTTRGNNGGKFAEINELQQSQTDEDRAGRFRSRFHSYEIAALKLRMTRTCLPYERQEDTGNTHSSVHPSYIFSDVNRGMIQATRN